MKRDTSGLAFNADAWKGVGQLPQLGCHLAKLKVRFLREVGNGRIVDFGTVAPDDMNGWNRGELLNQISSRPAGYHGHMSVGLRRQ